MSTEVNEEGTPKGNFQYNLLGQIHSSTPWNNSYMQNQLYIHGYRKEKTSGTAVYEGQLKLE
jgi:hypothetical protein